MSDHGHISGIYCRDCITSTTSSAAPPSTDRPTFADLLNDPTHHLDTGGVVARSILGAGQPGRLSTAEREWLSNEVLHGYDAVIRVVEQILASRAVLADHADTVAQTKAAVLRAAAETSEAMCVNTGTRATGREWLHNYADELIRSSEGSDQE